MKVLFVILCVPLLFSCFGVEDNDSCSITVDSVKIIDSYQVEGNNYYLVYRVSGWNDKTEILELYDKKPVFDHCSKSNIEAVFGDSLELSKKITHVYLNPDQNTLEVEYADGLVDGKSNNTLKLELK
ncbi:MAG: hypothetical protein ACTIM4_16150 [Marinomonas sp.]